MSLRSWLLVAAAACSSSSSSATDKRAAPPAPASKPVADDRYDADSLGALSFQLSEGSPEARQHFMRGLLALHSFWYDEATREFQAAIAADPKMNMAYWGAAMSLCKLLWGDDDVAAARALLQRMPDPDHLPPREQAWIVATVALLTDNDVRTSRKRFAEEMEHLHAQFPDDESATFLALALLSTIRPEDPDPTPVRKRAAGLAIEVFQHNPKHPGAAHYLIHAYDTPELAPQALPYARAYAKLAPAAFHARHMPAHIFVRLGMWQDAITSCQAAWDASVAAARREKLSADHDDFHSLNWLVEMNFELGHRKAADAALSTFADAVRAGLGHPSRLMYASQVASYLARTNEWSRVDDLLAPLDKPATDDASPATRTGSAASHCAPAAPATSAAAVFERQAIAKTRLRAAAMLHDVAKVEHLETDLDKIRAELRPILLASQSAEGLARLDRAEARSRAALRARAHGDERTLLKVLRESVADEVEQVGESNPTGFLVHEQIADTLLHLAQPKAAAAEYALVLDKHPGRAHALLGAARAAAALGDTTTARATYDKLLAQWTSADDGFDGLAEARAALRP